MSFFTIVELFDVVSSSLSQEARKRLSEKSKKEEYFIGRPLLVKDDNGEGTRFISRHGTHA